MANHNDSIRNLGFMKVVKESTGLTNNTPPPREKPPLPYEPYTGEINVPFWQEYENLGAAIQGLGGAVQRHEASQVKVSMAVKQATDSASEHKKVSKKILRRKMLIDECETHWFFSKKYLQPQLWFKDEPGPAGKAARQKEKLGTDTASEVGLERRMVQTAAERDAAQRECAFLLAKALQRRRLGMFEAVLMGFFATEVNALQAHQHVKNARIGGAVPPRHHSSRAATGLGLLSTLRRSHGAAPACSRRHEWVLPRGQPNVARFPACRRASTRRRTRRTSAWSPPR